MKSYKYWKQKFSQDNLLPFSTTAEGLLWLKLRSIDRKDILEEFCKYIGKPYAGKLTTEELWKLLNADPKEARALEKFMCLCQVKEDNKIDATFDQIRSNLYKMKHFHWGGGLETHLIKLLLRDMLRLNALFHSMNLAKFVKQNSWKCRVDIC